MRRRAASSLRMVGCELPRSARCCHTSRLPRHEGQMFDRKKIGALRQRGQSSNGALQLTRRRKPAGQPPGLTSQGFPCWRSRQSPRQENAFPVSNSTTPGNLHSCTLSCALATSPPPAASRPPISSPGSATPSAPAPIAKPSLPFAMISQNRAPRVLSRGCRTRAAIASSPMAVRSALSFLSSSNAFTPR
jgi:hypothetical protein